MRVTAPWEKFHAYRWTRFSYADSATHPPIGTQVLFVDEIGLMAVCVFDGADVVHHLNAVRLEMAQTAVFQSACMVLSHLIEKHAKKRETLRSEADDETLWETVGSLREVDPIYFCDPMAWMPLPPPPAVLSHDSGSDQFEAVDGTFDVLNAIEPVVRQAIAEYLAKGVRA